MAESLPGHRKLVSAISAALVGAGLLFAIGWMAVDALKPRTVPRSFSTTELPAPPPPRVRTGVDLATLPWSRDVSRLVPAQVQMSALPWSRRSESPQTATVYFGSMPWSRSPQSPQIATVYFGSLPWTRSVSSPGRASLYPASLPRLPVFREWLKPQPARVNTAESPWTANRPPIVHGELYTARVPVLRSAIAPEPANVNPASIPWQRDPRQPRPVHLEPARLSQVK